MAKAHKNWRVKTKIQRTHLRCPDCWNAHARADGGRCVRCGTVCTTENCYCGKAERRRKERCGFPKHMTGQPCENKYPCSNHPGPQQAREGS